MILMDTLVAGRSEAVRRRRFALFEYGFRPFFLLCGLYALVSVPLWLWIYTHGGSPLATLPPQFWHAHEMLYGFVAAAIAGFLLTAVPSWTGSRGFAGAPLIGLALLWIAGRVVFAAGDRLPFWLFAVVELSFLPALAALLAPPLLRAQNRNTPMLIVLGVLWLGDGAFVAAASFGDALLSQRALHLAINLVLLLVTIIGGRIVPAFTANALRRRGETADIVVRPRLERIVIALMVAVVLADLFGAGATVAGGLAALAAVAHAWRLSGWRGPKTLSEPIVWSLHIGYAWLPIGFALKALWLLGGVSWSMYWLHAFTMGVFGTMILAVTTRASLGHTGRPLVVSKTIAVAYLVLTAAVMLRVWGPALDVLGYTNMVTLSGALWTVAFALYLFVYTPILIRPRADGKPG
jgi:uncharacterized protein involved in response to NO